MTCFGHDADRVGSFDFVQQSYQLLMVVRVFVLLLVAAAVLNLFVL